MSEATETMTGHNAQIRKRIINDVVREIANLEAKRKEISEEIRTIKQKKIKGDLDMKIADFNAVMRLYSLESEDRDKYLSTLQETFDALGVGDQLDFIAAAERASGANEAAAEKAAEAQAAAT